MLRRNGSLESASAALNPETAKKWVAEKHSCDAGTELLHRKEALESTSVALEPDWCVGILSAALERQP